MDSGLEKFAFVLSCYTSQGDLNKYWQVAFKAINSRKTSLKMYELYFDLIVSVLLVFFTNHVVTFIFVKL